MNKSFSLLLAVVTLSCLEIRTRADLANVAGRALPSSNRPLWATGNWNIQKLVDGDTQSAFHLDTAPEPGAAYLLDLGQARAIHEIRLFPRQDECCPERLRQIRVSVHADAGGAVGAELWGADLFTDGSNAGSGEGMVVLVTPSKPVTAQWVQVQSLEDPVGDYALQMTELEVWADVPASEVNRALNALVRTSEPLYAGRDPAALVDGNRGTGDPQVLHGQETITSPYFYEINLGTEVTISRIVVWARQDTCCPERLTNYRVSVHPDAQGIPGTAVWSADVRTDGSNPGSDPGSRDELTAQLNSGGIFRGQWIRLQTLDDPPPSYSLQMSEVEVYGEAAGIGALLLTHQPQDLSGHISGTVTISIAAFVAGGDASQISYQWQRNGTNVPGATSANYETPALTIFDDKATFRCIVGYPNQPSRTSDEAELRIDIAYQAAAFSNRSLWAPGGWAIQMLTDGNRQGVFHLDTEPEAGADYEIDLGAQVKIEEMDLFPRQDGCCPERLTQLRVSVHKDNAGVIGDAVWHADLFTDGTNPGALPGTVVRLLATADPSGTFEGQWIRILSLEDPVQNYALQMTELEVFGSYAIQAPILQIATEPEDYGTAPGRVGRFTVNARVLNGDPAQITYQWQKNGVDIPGATATSYTTDPTLESDAGAKFRVRIGYPSVTSLISREAVLSFDNNYAKGQPAISNRPLWPPGNWNIAMLTDGDRRGVFHLDQFYDPGAAYEVDLGGEVAIERIDIYPRQDGCCPERFTNLRVTVHPAAASIGDAVWQADVFTDGSNPGSSDGAIVTLEREADADGTFTGRWVRIQSLDDPGPQYGLQMTELEVYGRWTGPVDIPLKVQFTRGLANMVLQWNTGTLESAATVTGPFEPVAEAASPYTASFEGNSRYYRVHR